MADIIQLRGSPHDEARDLLPWFVNGTLEPEEAARVEKHLGECADCRADLAVERRLAALTTDLPAPPEADHSGLRAPTGLWSRRVPVGWAIASPLAAAAAVALFFVSVNPKPVETQQYHALGAATSAQQQANMVVQFANGARVAQMQSALARANARLVDGPTETGAYLLRVDEGKRDLALKSLRDNESIALAEPIDGAGSP